MDFVSDLAYHFIKEITYLFLILAEILCGQYEGSKGFGI